MPIELIAGKGVSEEKWLLGNDASIFRSISVLFLVEINAKGPFLLNFELL